MKSEIISEYKMGRSINQIAKKLDIRHEYIEEFLIDLKESNRYRRTFTDDFKKIIAERDSNGVTRKQISVELGINPNTVKKACEQFGQPLKEKVDSHEMYDRVDGEFSGKECISCNSSKVNEVDENTIYCKNCGDEYIIKSDHALRVIWEYLD